MSNLFRCQRKLLAWDGSDNPETLGNSCGCSSALSFFPSRYYLANLDGQKIHGCIDSLHKQLEDLGFHPRKVRSLGSDKGGSACRGPTVHERSSCGCLLPCCALRSQTAFAGVCVLAGRLCVACKSPVRRSRQDARNRRSDMRPQQSL